VNLIINDLTLHTVNNYLGTTMGAESLESANMITGSQSEVFSVESL
jgi:hypothetical protein